MGLLTTVTVSWAVTVTVTGGAHWPVSVPRTPVTLAVPLSPAPVTGTRVGITVVPTPPAPEVLMVMYLVMVEVAWRVVVVVGSAPFPPVADWPVAVTPEAEEPVSPATPVAEAVALVLVTKTVL